MTYSRIPPQSFTRSDLDEAVRRIACLLSEDREIADWTERARRTLAQALLAPSVTPRGTPRPPGREHAAGLRLAGRLWAGCTTFERLPPWVQEAAQHRDPELEPAAEHLRRHLRIARR